MAFVSVEMLSHANVRKVPKYLQMLALHDAGKTHEEIGKMFHHPRGHVSRCLRTIKNLITAGMVLPLIAVLWLCSPAIAEVALLQVAGRQVCDGPACMPQIVHSTASCVCIGQDAERRYFLTSGHVFRGIQPLKTQIQLRQGWHAADIQAVSDVPDLACLTVPLDGDRASCALAETLPEPGAEVTQVGFTRGGPYQVRRGAVRQLAMQEGMLAVQVTVDEGDSGGPILYQGKTIGILKGYSLLPGERGTAVAVDATCCRRWLQSRGILIRSAPAPPVLPPAPAKADSFVPELPAAAVVDHSDLQQQLTEIMRRLNAGELRGPPGPPGPAGEQGFTGPAADLAELQQLRRQVTQLQAQLNQIKQIATPIRTRRPDGTVFSEDVVNLFAGDAIEFTLKPRSQ